jgi:hypothetical protein
VVLARKWVENRAWEKEKEIPFMQLLGFKRKSVQKVPAA